MQAFWAQKESEYEQLMVSTSHVISIETTPDVIIKVIDEFVAESMNSQGYCSLMH
jgi:hypothetical protein